MIETPGRPCRFCIANWAGATGKHGRPPLVPEVSDCKMSHRDDLRVYRLARAMASVMRQRQPTGEQISWFLEDADGVVDDFAPEPDKWKVRRLPMSDNDYDQGINVRLRINDVTYVGLEGGKDCRGSVVKLSTFRSWERGGQP